MNFYFVGWVGATGKDVDFEENQVAEIGGNEKEKFVAQLLSVRDDYEGGDDGEEDHERVKYRAITQSIVDHLFN